MAEILDIKGSTKFETTFLKRRELVEKALLDTAQVLEKRNKSKGNLKLSQQNRKILDAKKCPIEPDAIVRPSTSYFVPQSPGRHFKENRHKTTLSLTPLKLENEKYKQKHSTSFHNPVNISPTNNPKNTLFPGKESIDALIDSFIEGEESIIQDVTKVLPTSLLMQREFETGHLPVVNFMRFNGDSKQCPNFIQNFKNRVYKKISFRKDSALELLKREFGNPLMVSHLKLKEVLELPPIQHDNQNSLKN